MAETRICNHMNEDHQLSLFMIVDSTLGRRERNVTVSNCKMTAINLKESKISYVACKNDTCSQREVVIKFVPPMNSFVDMRPRLAELHHEKSEPKISWLVTEPLCRLIILMIMGLGYAHHFLDFQELANKNDLFRSVFGSEGQILAFAIQCSLIFAVGAHLAEAVYGFYLCKKILQFRNKASVLWFFMISMVGYPMTSKCIEFARIQKNHSKEKK